MTRIYIDTDELHQMSSDLRRSTGEVGDLLGSLWAGFGDTWLGVREAEFEARQAAEQAEIRILALRVGSDAVGLDVEAWMRDADDAIDSFTADLLGAWQFEIHELRRGWDWTWHVSGDLLAGLGHQVEDLVDVLGHDLVAVAGWSIKFGEHVLLPLLVDAGGLVVGFVGFVGGLMFKDFTDTLALPFMLLGISGADIRTNLMRLISPTPHRRSESADDGARDKLMGSKDGKKKGSTSLEQLIDATNDQPLGTFKVIHLGDGKVVILLQGIQMKASAYGTVNNIGDATFAQASGTSKYVAEVQKYMATLPEGTEVTLIGHSQGGIVARAIAADPAFAAHEKLHIVDVITAESPVHGEYVPNGTKALEIANNLDPVAAPDLRPDYNNGRVSTVNFYGEVGEHDPSQFLRHLNPGAQASYDNFKVGFDQWMGMNGAPATPSQVETYQLVGAG